MNVDWHKELDDLLNAAKSPEEYAATKAFANAIGPYLANPAMLRTLLGKIQSPMEADTFGVIATQQKFASLDEIKEKLPQNVELVGL